MAAHQLQLFESTKDIYYRVFRRVRPRTIPPEILIHYKPYANANCYIRWKDQRLHVLLADSLRNVPPEVIEAIAIILISKIYRKAIPEDSLAVYRDFMNLVDTRTRLDSVRRQRGRKHFRPPEGEHYNLDEIFESINLRYFNSELSKPIIGWSSKPSTRTLGHYDPVHHAIIISSFLDTREAGIELVEYVMYHEMLHIKHPIEYSGARRKIHPRSFRDEESAYPGFEEIKERLRKYCHRRRSDL